METAINTPNETKSMFPRYGAVEFMKTAINIIAVDSETNDLFYSIGDVCYVIRIEACTPIAQKSKIDLLYLPVELHPTLGRVLTQDNCNISMPAGIASAFPKQVYGK